MRIPIIGLVAMGMLSAPAYSGIVFTTDDSTGLVGSFSLTGHVPVTDATPGVFELAPPPNCNELLYYRGENPGISAELGFGTLCATGPANAFEASFELPASSTTFADVSGSYDLAAGLSAPLTYFRLWDLQDTGGLDGTFSGDFCFSRNSTACNGGSTASEPDTLALFAVTLAGALLVRRGRFRRQRPAA